MRNSTTSMEVRGKGGGAGDPGNGAEISLQFNEGIMVKLVAMP